MKCKIACLFFLRYWFLFRLGFWPHLEVFVEHIIFCTDFSLFCLRYHAFVNPSFTPICFNDQAGPSIQVIVFKCNLTDEK